MFFRILNFFILMAFAMPTTVWSDPEGRDLVISYSIPSKKRQVLFQDVVKGSIAGKTRPDDYHITLGWVKNVDSSDYAVLRNHLNNIASTYLDQRTTFTAAAAKPYLVNRTANRCGVVLTPKPQEAARFKNINKALHQELKHYNQHTGNTYAFHKDLLPLAYVPHISLATTNHIQSLNLNRNRLIRQINSKINGKNIELLHEKKAAAPKKSITRRAVTKHRYAKQASKHKQKADKHMHAAIMHRRAAAHRHPFSYAARRHRDQAAKHRHEAMRHRHEAAQYRKALKRRRHR
jgi:hypothetical protein